ncbi:MAG: TetR/AcrR family transcriptional regulator [Gordonibacter sp.]|uniref:TetR/AcrR family transcriptional regulator n=1 Tax=Gordonibacter sp. TaxID=1968902 RepID=UPI002FC5857B
MYSGKNPSALKSQRALAWTLYELMQSCAYQKITITELCAQAGVSRQTFYQLFASKDEVIRMFLRIKLRRGFEDIDDRDCVDLSDIIRDLLFPLERDRAFLRLLYRNGLDGPVSDELLRVISIATERVQVAHSRRTRGYADAFLAGGLTNLLLAWVIDDEPLSDHAVARIISDILQGRYYTDPLI